RGECRQQARSKRNLTSPAACIPLTRHHIVVHPTIASCVPSAIEANVVGVSPLNEPNSSDCVLPLAPLCCSANRDPSRETFDQGSCVNEQKLLGPLDTPAPSLVRRIRPVPLVLTFHNPLLLVSALPMKELFSTRNSSVVLLMARTAIIAIVALLKIVWDEPPVAGRMLIALGPR